MLTRPASERNGRQTTSSRQKHDKSLRNYFLLCSLMFCANNQCSMPLHILVADLVESQGGTAFLIKALNKLGVCSSEDTLHRFIQSKVDTRDDKHPCNGYFNSDTFTIVSVDNIDFLHSFARVFKGSENSSWHGTTVQVVQPMPSLNPVQCQSQCTPHSESSVLDISLEHNYPLTEVQNCHSTRKRAERSSPVPSPLKLTRSPTAKSLRRARTGTEQKEKVSHQERPPLTQIQHSEFAKSLSCVLLNDFLLKDQENESLQDLHSDLFIYMLQKVAVAKFHSEESFLAFKITLT